MTQLSLKVKAFLVRFFDDQRTAYYIDKAQFDRLHTFLMDGRKPQYVDLLDDEGNYKETLKRNEFTLEAAEVRQESGDCVWLCAFGTRHPMHQWPASECGCMEKYTSEPMMVRTVADFKAWIKQMMNQSVIYDGDITDEMRARFLQAKKQYA